MTELTLYVTTDKVWLFTVLDENGNPYPVYGSTIAFTAKDKLGGVVLFTKTTGAGITILDTPTQTLGQFQVTVAASDTTGKTPQDYVYDILITIGGKQYVLVPPSTLHLLPLV